MSQIMIAKITSKRQVTFPARVLDALGVGPGDASELIQTARGFVLRPRRVDLSKLAPLAGALPRGKVSFELDKFRAVRRDDSLRD